LAHIDENEQKLTFNTIKYIVGNKKGKIFKNYCMKDPDLATSDDLIAAQKEIDDIKKDDNLSDVNFKYFCVSAKRNDKIEEVIDCDHQ